MNLIMEKIMRQMTLPQKLLAIFRRSLQRGDAQDD